MPPTGSIDYKTAQAYVSAWAHADHDDLSGLRGDAANFMGKLGSLNFMFVQTEGVLHVWGLVQMGAGSLQGNRQEIKVALDQIAKEHPDEVAGCSFDVRSLPWNPHTGQEPCLYLRLDVAAALESAEKAQEKFKAVSDTAYAWHREKYMKVLQEIRNARSKTPH